MTRDLVISSGVKNLKEFGYPVCNKDNILTNAIYKRLFLVMLEESIIDGDINNVITQLISEINT